MRISLPSRYFLFIFGVSLFARLTTPSFAAELTLPSLSQVAGLTFQMPLTPIQERAGGQLPSYTFSGKSTSTLTILSDKKKDLALDSFVITPPTEDISFTPTPIEIASPTPTITITPTPVLSAPASSPTPPLTQVTKAAIQSVQISPTIAPNIDKPAAQPLSTIIPTPTPTRAPAIVLAPSDIDSLFSRYSDQYHVDKEVLKRIAKCESSFNQNAVNGDYLGMFQFATSSWIVTRSAMNADTNPDLRTNSEESVRTAAYKLSQNGSGAWPNC